MFEAEQVEGHSRPGTGLQWLGSSDQPSLMCAEQSRDLERYMSHSAPMQTHRAMKGNSSACL